jgi:hypothetical protein
LSLPDETKEFPRPAATVKVEPNRAGGNASLEIEDETFVRFFFLAGCHGQGSERLTSECGGGGVRLPDASIHGQSNQDGAARGLRDTLLWNNIYAALAHTHHTGLDCDLQYSLTITQ